MKRLVWACISGGWGILILGLLIAGFIPLRWNANSLLAGIGLIFLAAAFLTYSDRWNLLLGRLGVAFLFLWMAETCTLFFLDLQLYFGERDLEFTIKREGEPPFRDWTYMTLGGPLGYQPDPLLKVRAKKAIDDELIYEVEYNFNRHGYRKTGGNAKGACSFVFFADSFTFGTGLNDKDALPEQFSRNLNYQYQVVNLGVSGYGPHQMLRSLELDLPSLIVQRPISTVFYIWVPHHSSRIMGATSWNRFGPKYILNDKNEPIYSGKLNDYSGSTLKGWSFKQDLVNMFRLSRLFRKLYKYPETMDPDFQAYSVNLLTAIVAKSRDIVEKRYGAKFVVITWKNDTDQSKNTIASLKRANIHLVNNGDVFSGWSDDYFIKGDFHPSAIANRDMGKQLTERFGKCG